MALNLPSHEISSIASRVTAEQLAAALALVFGTDGGGIESDGNGAMKVAPVSAPLASGAATAANQATQITDLVSLIANTTGLALEGGGNLAAILAKLPASPALDATLAALSAKFAALGQHAAASSLSVVPASDYSDGAGGTKVSQQAAQPVSGTLQSAATATGNGTALTVTGEASVVVTVSGTFVGTITFEGTEDGANWSSLNALQLGTNTVSTTATAPGTFQLAGAGLAQVRARISAYTSGSITVTGHAVPLTFSPHVVNVNLAQKLAGEDLTNDVMKSETRSNYSNITTATTTTIKSGAGRLIAVTLNTPVASASATIYDNTAGSGTKIGTITLPATLLSQGPQGVAIGGGQFNTGLTVVTVGTADWTFWYI